MIGRVEALLEDVLGALVDDTEMVITLRSRVAGQTRKTNTKPTKQGGRPLSRLRKITFPGSTAKEAWTFSEQMSLPTLQSLTLCSCACQAPGNGS